MVRAHQQGAAARRPDRVQRGQARPRLVRAHRGRRRGRLRRAAQRLRADEGDDRGRRRRRALRGPARQREEVRPPRRQGAGADRQLHPHADRGAPRRRRDGRAHRAGGPHRRRERASCITSDVDPRDAPVHRPGERTSEGFYRLRGGIDVRHRPRPGLRALRRPALVRDQQAGPRTRRARFAEAIHAKFPGKLLAYNCSPSFNWKKNLDDATIARFQRELGAMGYKFQFVTLAGFHALNHAMFELARGYTRARHGRLHRAAGGRVRRGAPRLHRHPPPARGRHRLLRPGGHRRLGRHRLHPGAGALHRGGPVHRRRRHRHGPRRGAGHPPPRRGPRPAPRADRPARPGRGRAPRSPRRWRSWPTPSATTSPTRSTPRASTGSSPPAARSSGPRRRQLVAEHQEILGDLGRLVRRWPAGPPARRSASSAATPRRSPPACRTTSSAR